LDSFLLVGLCYHGAINERASYVLKRAIGQRAVMYLANEYIAVGIAGKNKLKKLMKRWPTAGEFDSVVTER
jgi:hypothetical protein